MSMRWPSHSLLVTTSLSTGFLLLAATGTAHAQVGCTSISGSTCTVGSSGQTLDDGFRYTDTGSGGSGSTAGGAGPSYTYDVLSNIDTSGINQAAYVQTTGGNGSDNGPSAGGNGGSIVFNGPSTISLLVDAYASGTMAAVSLTSNGGNGTDNNTNDGSDGAPGGSGEAITYNGGSTALSLQYSSSSYDSSSYEAVGLDLYSLGGRGGRANESVIHPIVYGGDGGDASTVTATTSTVTVGSNSVPMNAAQVFGVRARSQGQRGPDDYNSSNGENQGGGGASTGGYGSAVSVTSNGVVTVIGNAYDGSLFGILAESLGGNGGWAYNVDALGLTEGGEGGESGEVSIDVAADVVVTDPVAGSTGTSAAIGVNTQGGDGGEGQSGYKGGNGGDSGSAFVSVTGGSITATGTSIDVIVARSQGGRGGDGLENANNSQGGDGGDGGGASVTIDTSGTLQAASSSNGNDSGRGIVAQSIGYFGGGGSDGNEVFGNPGSAGNGGNGGAVNVNLNEGTLKTDGTDDLGSGLQFTAGIFAQSIGGGGGDGGDFQGLFGGEGGAGGKGGNGGTVTIGMFGTIDVQGAQGYGILAQSIGGGGGAGGVSDALVVALGGSGGAGGSSDTVSITNGGSITTDGYNAVGILAQSIVGGGGAAGVSAAALSIGATSGSDASTTAGTVKIYNTGSVGTSGDAATAILAQSIGGGGGSAGGGDGSDSYGIFTLGGSGSAGGNGGAVDVYDIGTLSTQGAYAHGLHAQSVGGGGGAGGDVMSGGITSLTVPIAFGGMGGYGGNGGAVSVGNVQDVSVTTDGNASIAILAQSVGGGGGSGGDATTDAIISNLQFATGGFAGDGGAGGTVDVDLTNAGLTTRQNRSAAILAQSVGGGGGSGGSATSSNIGFFSIAFAAGGFGGGGGSGQAVTVDVAASTIQTAQAMDTSVANDAIGIIAQSVGGGGGQGGAAAAQAITTGIPIDPEDPDVTISVNAQFALGGVAGDGGNGGDVTVALSDGSVMTTNGAGSHGILAQSVGGGGGTGGDASTATTTVPDSFQSYALTIDGALGGAGGDGGSGGTVAVTVGSTTAPSGTSTQIATTGDYANGIVAQSIGGGGGNSGVPSTSTKSILNENTIGITMSLGSINLLSSELGAAGGKVTVDLAGDGAITTQGDGSRGIVAQSIGGGGGVVQGGEIGVSADISGGGGDDIAAAAEDDDGSSSFKASATVQLGMKGGAGGDSDLVTVDLYNGSTVVTAGGDADGILAQSIGGGGGLAGSLGSTDSGGGSTDAVTALAEDDGDDGIDVSATVSVGGSGGTGGDSGGISIIMGGRITTTGDWADGVVAQAIGGGGGTGGTSSTTGGSDSTNIDVSVGGTGGTAGQGGPVTIGFNDDAPGNFIHTSGYAAYAVLLQSIGGGGGQGADGSDQATGSLTVGSGVGGKGGAAGDGGTVTASGWLNGGNTAGDDAHALVAQSIGGGGGTAGAGSSAASDDQDSHTVEIVVGGQGGASGNGGQVNLTIGGPFQTGGDRAFGLVAQSIGGGGGIGNSGSAESTTSLVLGGQGGNGGTGGAVTVDLTASSSINTYGTGSHAIVAQSIGGGGGIGGDATGGTLNFLNRSRTASDGSGGDGGTVEVTVDAGITTRGSSAFGILAQSIGGGGGFGGDADGAFAGATGDGSGGSSNGGEVTVTQSGSISAQGENSIGIFAQSQGSQDDGDVSVTVNGSVTGGSGTQGAGVVVDGATQTVTTGTGGSIGAASGNAIVYYTDGSYTSTGSSTAAAAAAEAAPPAAPLFLLTNSGTIVGDVVHGWREDTAGVARPDGWENAPVIGRIVNESGGTLTGAGRYDAAVVNRGTVEVGDGSGTGKTTIAGDFTQEAGGRLAVDADFDGGTVDLLTVEGLTTLAGSLGVTPVTLRPGRALTFLDPRGGLTGRLEAEADPIYTYAIADNGSGQLAVSVAGADFTAPGGLAGNQSEVAGHLQQIWDAGGGDAEMARLFAQLGADAGAGGGTYADDLADLSAGVALAPGAAKTTDMQVFADSLMSCPTFTRDDAMTGERSCSWTTFGGRLVDADGQGGVSGYDVTTVAWALGAQKELAPHWFLGAAGAYERSWIDGDDNRVNSDGQSVYGGLVLKRESGPWLFAAAAGGGYSWYDTTRKIRINGFQANADSSPDVQSAYARLRAAYTATFGPDLYVKPSLDLDALYTRTPSYREHGAGSLDLVVDSSDQTTFAASPTVEIGGRVKVDDHTAVRPYLTLGASFYSQDDYSTQARLKGAPGGGFDTTLPLDDKVAKVGAGLQLLTDGPWDLRVQYEGRFADHATSHAGTLKASFAF